MKRIFSVPTLKKIVSLVEKNKRFLITTHIRPDGDAVGSVLALYFILKKKKKRCHIVCDGGISARYLFLPGANKVGTGPEDLWKKYDIIFAIDCAGESRLESIKDAILQNVPVINIDHHESNTAFGEVNWVDPSFSSCGEMIYELAKALNVKITKNIATNIYVALISDTNRFQFSNTNRFSHLVAAELLSYGVKPAYITKALYRQKLFNQLLMMADFMKNIKIEDDVAYGMLTEDFAKKYRFYPTETEEFIDTVKSIRGVKIALLFRELMDGKIKVSIRAEVGFSASKFARLFGGGGHARAAGFEIKSDIEKVKKMVLEKLKAWRKK